MILFFFFFFTLPPSLPLPFFLLLLLLPRINHHSPTIARRLAFSTFPPPPLAKSHKLCMAPCEANLSLLHSSLAPFSNCRGGGGSLSHKKGRRLYQYVKWGDSSQSDLVKRSHQVFRGGHATSIEPSDSWLCLHRRKTGSGSISECFARPFSHRASRYPD